MSTALATYNNYRPSLMGRSVFDDMFETVFNDWPAHVKQSTQGYPVADIYSDDDNTFLEFALAGFKKEELSVTVQQDKQSITVSAQSDEAGGNGRRIARRSFTKTYVNYDNNLDLSGINASFENGLLRVAVPKKAEVQPVQISIN